ncbi:hypothetical protein N7495_002190 [Penicillium taxi]|uniref:uncharacterized protein n=1 Tax=Penicillium taxi TaxID=168475 RepID=UPI0025458480|nr:uncharacterized protein N7495_002190 [Penicillium taxi]KAJ5901662.1 hypothetical protein N7495_002190 [Penicillium taxi]
MPDKLEKAIMDEARHAQTVALDVARSGAYLYPFKGIFYFAMHKDLWQPFVSKAGQTLSLGLGVTTFMFFFTYVPQLAIMFFTSGPLAAISAALLVLTESSTLTRILMRSFVGEETLMDTFDATLIARGQEPLVAQGREVKPKFGGISAVARLGKAFSKPISRIMPRSLLKSLILLPLNLIPVVGTVLYVFMQGKRLGPGLHGRYFQLKAWDSRRQEEWVNKNRAAYTGMGIAAAALEMVPFASILFSFTNTVGAALWASDLEKSAA